MRCFKCNEPSRGDICNTCAQRDSERRKSDSVFDRRVVKVQTTVTSHVTNSAFADKLRAALR